MIIDGEKITIKNSNFAHKLGALDLQKFDPFPINPAISKVFIEIKAQVRLNNKITRQDMAKGAGVSVKTIQRALKEIDNLNYVGSGNN